MHRVATNLEDLLVGAASILLAAWLVYLSPRHPATRALALFLGVLGLASLEAEDTLHSLAAAQLAIRLDAHAELAIPFAAVAFAALFPRPVAFIARAPRLFGLGLLAAAVAAQLLPLADPSLYGTLEPRASGGHVDDESDLLQLVRGFRDVTLLALGLVILARWASERSEGRDALLPVAAGFAAPATVGLYWVLLDARRDLQYDASERWAMVMYEVAALVAVATLAVYAWVAVREPARRRVAVVASLFLAVSALAVLVAGDREFAVGDAPGWILLETLSGLALPLAVTYAVLSHRLLEVEVKLRWTIRRGTVVAAFLVVFLIVQQVAEAMLSESYGVFAGGAAAGLLLFALAPLQRAAEAVAERALPTHRALDDRRARNEEVYRRAARLAYADGVLSREEERHLAELATALDIDASRALTLREEAEDATRAAAPA